MAVDVIMPQWGMGTSEGTIVKWLKSVGDQVTEGEPLVEVETAKATDVLDAPASGVLVEVIAAEDDEVPVGDVLARIEASEGA